MQYRRSGLSGLKLSALSLGLWHNFGDVDTFVNYQKIIHKAFDLGITHFDLANNYGPPAGSAETNFGRILQTDLKSYRDELIVSTKAGYDMWPGPYGDFGSRKYMLASLDQSLKRMQVDYVDIYYSHRPDPETPLEETMGALDYAVRSGKALYAGISNYPAETASRAADILAKMGTPCLIHQPKYSMFERWTENGLLEVLEEKGMGCIAFSPLAQGMLTNKYLNGIPKDSRAGKVTGALQSEQINAEILQKINALNEIAKERNQSLAQMAIVWLLKDVRITSVLIGASSVEQLVDNVNSLKNMAFEESEIGRIEKILK
ncbi:L-glyceraldehyde 3-phosphate reductase [Flavobacterium sp. N3904]|uniref:L-glyceraldehyde 3-phosphate reductase n=1 Tax=Flavobacterium sp. N3904 TaxID=2986835 RepID=UPI0029CABB6C|nr:L-glyceraldehyde 3-phosphate reductase [Flavobacterium sp. N3904]